jgi:hypothetical protein
MRSKGKDKKGERRTLLVPSGELLVDRHRLREGTSSCWRTGAAVDYGRA